MAELRLAPIQAQHAQFDPWFIKVQDVLIYISSYSRKGFLVIVNRVWALDSNIIQKEHRDIWKSRPEFALPHVQTAPLNSLLLEVGWSCEEVQESHKGIMSLHSGCKTSWSYPEKKSIREAIAQPANSSETHPLTEVSSHLAGSLN